jgi:tetratricopeptide (TPR) repeat protein
VKGADDIKVDQLWYQGVRITGLRDGRMIYTVRGAPREAPLAQVNGLRFGSYPEWEQADKAIEAGNGAQAAELLQKMIGNLGRRQAYLRPVVIRKMIEAYDTDALFADALERYLELAREQSDPYYFALVPSKLPTNEAIRKAAVATITRSLDNVNAAAKPALEKLLGQLKEAAPPEPTPAAGGQTNAPSTQDTTTRTNGVAPETPGTDDDDGESVSTGNDRVDRIFTDIDAGEFDRALEAVAFMKARSRNPPMGLLYYAQGLAHAGKKQPLDAAVAFLRVAVHFPEHEKAVPALIAAGQMLKTAGKDQQAAGVWREAMGRTEDVALRRQIQQLLSSVN